MLGRVRAAYERGGGDGRDADRGELYEPDDADADDLAGENLTCRHPGEQDFRDAVRLLLYDAGEHGPGVEADREVHQSDCDEPHRVRVLVGGVCSPERATGETHGDE